MLRHPGCCTNSEEPSAWGDNGRELGSRTRRASEAGSEPTGHGSLLRATKQGRSACVMPAEALQLHRFFYTRSCNMKQTGNYKQRNCNNCISLVSPPPSPNGSYLLTLRSSCRRLQEITRLFQGNAHSH